MLSGGAKTNIQLFCQDQSRILSENHSGPLDPGTVYLLEPLSQALPGDPQTSGFPKTKPQERSKVVLRFGRIFTLHRKSFI